MTIGHEGRSERSVLRCGICFRNLTVEPGRSMHVVFSDGSMRCSAPEVLERVGPDTPHTYQPTHVVFDSHLRRVALERAFRTGALTSPEEVSQ